MSDIDRCGKYGARGLARLLMAKCKTMLAEASVANNKEQKNAD
ncbi:MAG: hypothetical protein ACJAT7_001273 [Psychromonas sp.]|jgi:hypothetical protein